MGRALEAMASKKSTIYLILALCLVLRLGFAWHHRHYVEDGDAANYISIAHNLADGRGFSWDHGQHDVSKAIPTAYGDPLFPFFLSLVFRLFGSNLLIVYILQALIDTLTCFMVFRIARCFAVPRGAPMLAALGYAVYPPYIQCVGTALTECLSFLLLVSAMYMLVRAFRGSVGQFAVAALIMGMLILIKPAMLLFPFVIVLMALLLRKQTPSWLAKAAVFVVVSYAVVAPWTIRNLVVMHAFIPVATHGGATIWSGTGPADGHMLADWSVPFYTANMPRPADPRAVLLSQGAYDRTVKLMGQLKTANEVQANNLYMAAAKEEVRANPGRFASLGVKKVFRLWFNLLNEKKPSKSSLALALFNFVLIALAVRSSIKRASDKMLVSSTLWLAIYTTVMSVCAMGVVRYSYPVYIFVFILASSGLLAATGGDQPKASNRVMDGEKVPV